MNFLLPLFISFWACTLAFGDNNINFNNLETGNIKVTGTGTEPDEAKQPEQEIHLKGKTGPTPNLDRAQLRREFLQKQKREKKEFEDKQKAERQRLVTDGKGLKTADEKKKWQERKKALLSDQQDERDEFEEEQRTEREDFSKNLTHP